MQTNKAPMQNHAWQQDSRDQAPPIDQAQYHRHYKQETFSYILLNRTNTSLQLEAAMIVDNFCKRQPAK
jgi:hypothetical protein